MRKGFKKIFIGLIMATLLVFPLALISFSPNVVNAQPAQATPAKGSLLCGIFPFLNNVGAFGIKQAACGGGSAGNVAGRTGSFISFALNLIFIGLIILAVFIIIRSAIKYIQSEGNEGKIQEAQKAIKSVFVGIGVLIIGIVGIFIVIAFFNASGTLTTDTNQTDVGNFLNQASAAS